MTLTIDVPSDVERALREQAQDTGQTVAEYVTGLLAQVATSRPGPSFGPQAVDIATRLAALTRIGSYRTRDGIPPLPDDAIAQAYSEREDVQL